MRRLQQAADMEVAYEAALALMGADCKARHEDFRRD